MITLPDVKPNQIHSINHGVETQLLLVDSIPIIHSINHAVIHSFLHSSIHPSKGHPVTIQRASMIQGSSFHCNLKCFRGGHSKTLRKVNTKLHFLVFGVRVVTTHDPGALQRALGPCSPPGWSLGAPRMPPGPQDSAHPGPVQGTGCKWICTALPARKHICKKT